MKLAYNELKQLVKENNALEYSLEHCMAWFESVEATWSKPSVNEGRLYGCINTCICKATCPVD